MKALLKAIRGHGHAVFLDLEATQREADMIELGALLSDLDENGIPRSFKQGLRLYVKPSHRVGEVVKRLTGIDDSLVCSKGVPFAEAIETLKSYVGRRAPDCVFVAYGGGDMHILEQSYSFHEDADVHFIRLIKKNYLDFSAFLSRYVKDENGNCLSLKKALDLFGIAFPGRAHDGLDDARGLALLYEAFSKNPPVLFSEYQKSLAHSHKLPEPIRRTFDKLLREGSVDVDDYLLAIKESLS